MEHIRRKIFISHYKENRYEVDAFINTFKNVFIAKALGANDNDELIDSANTNYVMQRIRDLYLEDSTVTIVLLGSCTHSRRYIDWEIKSSLRQGSSLPNGLIAIVLPSGNNRAHLPERFRSNWREDGGGYAQFRPYPPSELQLAMWIEEAHQSRTQKAHLIDNSLTMMKYSSKCKVCGETH